MLDRNGLFNVSDTNEFLPQLLQKDPAPVLGLRLPIRVEKDPNDERVERTDVDHIVKYCHGPSSGHPLARVRSQHLISGIDPPFVAL